MQSDFGGLVEQPSIRIAGEESDDCSNDWSPVGSLVVDSHVGGEECKKNEEAADENRSLITWNS